jgi:hypothetical protein
MTCIYIYSLIKLLLLHSFSFNNTVAMTTVLIYTVQIKRPGSVEIILSSSQISDSYVNYNICSSLHKSVKYVIYTEKWIGIVFWILRWLYCCGGVSIVMRCNDSWQHCCRGRRICWIHCCHNRSVRIEVPKVGSIRTFRVFNS